jgi:hypothetical protein
VTGSHRLRRRPLRLTGCPALDNFKEVSMFKRRFRLPSPALVIAMIALSQFPKTRPLAIFMSENGEVN